MQVCKIKIKIPDIQKEASQLYTYIYIYQLLSSGTSVEEPLNGTKVTVDAEKMRCSMVLLPIGVRSGSGT